jgi:hypothetical protein
LHLKSLSSSAALKNPCSSAYSGVAYAALHRVHPWLNIPDENPFIHQAILQLMSPRNALAR